MDDTKLEIVIVGAGGFGVEAAWVAEELGYRILGFLDDNPSLKSKEFFGYKVLGTAEEFYNRLEGRTVLFHVAIGKNKVRQKVAERLEGFQWKLATLAHPSAVIARTAVIGEGTYIGAGSIVAPGAKIGRCVLINTLAGIGHDSLLGDYVNICPGVRVNGDCQIGRGVFIGSNAVLQPGVKIGDGAVLGASSLIVRSVEPLVTVLGVPARIISRPAKSESPAE